MIKVRRTGASDYSRYVKMLLAGPPGSGKTLMSSQLPNVLIASAEGGLMSIADRNIPYVDIKSSKDLLQLKNMLDQKASVREELLGFQIDSIVIDTIDEIQKILIKERLTAEKRDAMGLQDWGWLTDQMRGIVRGFRNLDLHTMFTVHVKETSDADTGKTWYKPDLQGAIANEIPGYVDLSLLIQSATMTGVVDNKAAKVEKRLLVTRPTALYPFLKDRSGKLPAELEINFDNDFKKIHDIIFSGLDKLEEHEVVEIDEEKFAPPPLAPLPSPKEVAKARPAAKTRPRPTPVAVAPVEAPKPVEAKSEANEAKPEAKIEKPKVAKPSDAGANPLPDGIEPNDKGFDVGLFCTECGDECESRDIADLSRIRYRAILCKAHFDAKKK